MIAKIQCAISALASTLSKSGASVSSSPPGRNEFDREELTGVCGVNYISEKHLYRNV